MEKENKDISVCPHCHEQYILEIDMLGKDAKCHTCRNKFTVEHLRLCPFCSEVIQYTAKECKHCNRASQPIKVPQEESSWGGIIVSIVVIIIGIYIFSGGCSSDTSISHSSPSYNEVQKAKQYIKDYESGKIYSDIINEGRRKNGYPENVKINREYMKPIIEQQQKE